MDADSLTFSPLSCHRVVSRLSVVCHARLSVAGESPRLRKHRREFLDPALLRVVRAQPSHRSGQIA